MKQKYTILRNDAKEELIISEFGELDKEILSLLCEESYNANAIKAAIAKSKDSLISTLRTPNMYPPGLYVSKIADAVIELYSDTKNIQGSLDIPFNDIDYLTKENEEPDFAEDIEEEPDTLDDLLEDDLEDDFDDKDAIDPLNSPLKIADDESLDIEEEG